MRFRCLPATGGKWHCISGSMEERLQPFVNLTVCSILWHLCKWITRILGLDDLRWFRRRLKPNLKVPALNFTPRVRSGIAAINGVVYVCGGMGYSSLINDTENRAPWNQRTTQLSDIWAFDLSAPFLPSTFFVRFMLYLDDESDALLVPRSYSFKKHAENRLDRTHASTNLIIGDDGLTVTYDGPSSSPSVILPHRAVHNLL